MGNSGKVLRWVVAALFLLAFLWFVPQLQGQYFSKGVPAKEIPPLVNEYRRTWAQIIGGFALLLGLYFTWRTLQVNREGQITERFTRAIDQLGDTNDKQNPRLEIRIGGIYALERIAKDSPASDYSTVMEVLTAYVRMNAPLPVSGGYGGIGKQTPRADIQAALTVIGRRQPARVPEKRPVRIDLNRVDLRGADLRGADLSEAKIVRADLSGAKLGEANLNRADLYNADLRGADLRGADLRGADLREAELEEWQLERTIRDKNTQLPSNCGDPFRHWIV